MSLETRILLLCRRIAITSALLALAMLLALGCGGDSRRGGGDDDDDDDSASGDDDDDTGSGDDDDTGSGDDDDSAAGDDDDTGSGDDDDTGSGGNSSPVVVSVDVCEQPDPEPGSPACNAPDFYAQFVVTVSDADGDLQNPTVYLSVNGQTPEAIPLQGDLGSGGAFGLQVCSGWPRSGTVIYSVSVADAAAHESQPYPGNWAVPASAGAGDCL